MCAFVHLELMKGKCHIGVLINITFKLSNGNEFGRGRIQKLKSSACCCARSYSFLCFSIQQIGSESLSNYKTTSVGINMRFLHSCCLPVLSSPVWIPPQDNKKAENITVNKAACYKGCKDSRLLTQSASFVCKVNFPHGLSLCMLEVCHQGSYVHALSLHYMRLERCNPTLQTLSSVIRYPWRGISTVVSVLWLAVKCRLCHMFHYRKVGKGGEYARSCEVLVSSPPLSPHCSPWVVWFCAAWAISTIWKGLKIWCISAPPTSPPCFEAYSSWSCTCKEGIAEKHCTYNATILLIGCAVEKWAKWRVCHPSSDGHTFHQQN